MSSGRTDSDGGRTPTIYDVAAAAGVAPSTVSRAFSRPGRVNSETAERIRAVAEQLGYRVNPVARALSTSRTSLIAVVVADITNPFFAAIIRGVQAGAARSGYTVLLIDSEESEEIERDALIRALPLVDGVVLGSSRLSDSGIRMVAKQRPLVVINRAVSDVPSVVIDNRGGARSVLGHLAGLGHERLTYLAGPEASWPDGVRWRALRELAGDFGVRVQRRGPFSPTLGGGVRAADMLLQHPASAVITYNDQVAIGVMKRLAQLGARIPVNVSVVGFDNIVPAELVTPGLTTVEAPLYAQGMTAVRNLLASIDGARLRTGRPVVLPTRLVVRGSTAPPGPYDPATWEIHGDGADMSLVP
jgi:LacI family transcriptional regulator, repressor for deo operon, udp, cdd, tsx, nupC, and nupG